MLAQLAHKHLADGRDELARQAFEAVLATVAEATRDAAWLDDSDEGTAAPFAATVASGVLDTGQVRPFAQVR